jgi:hypothetical protein
MAIRPAIGLTSNPHANRSVSAMGDYVEEVLLDGAYEVAEELKP